MKATLRSFDNHFEWRLLPVWTSFSFLSGWLGLVTVWQLSEAGVDPSEAEPLLTILPWVPAFFVAMPFVGGALGVLVDRALEVLSA